MSWHTTLIIVNSTAIGFFLIAMVRAGTRPKERGFVPGLGLMGIAFVIALLREMLVIPRHLWLPARMVEVGLAILGFALIVRLCRAGMWRSSSSNIPRSR